MISFNSDKAANVFKEMSQKLDEYVCSSSTMDEQTYCSKYLDAKCPMAYIVHQPFDGGFNVFRSRLAERLNLENEDITNPSTFSYIPREKCTSNRPPIQRCNFSGHPMFYASMSIETNFKEIDKECICNKVAYVSKWQIDEDKYVNLFRIIPPEGIDIKEEYQGLLKIQTNRYPSYVTDYLRKVGEIFMNDSVGNAKYLPTALLSHYIFKLNYTGEKIFEGQSPNYHGIIYPSVKDQDRCSYNVALTPEFVDSALKLKYVIKGRVSEDLHTISFEEIGFCHDNSIVWYKPIVEKATAKPTNFWYVDKNNVAYNVNLGTLYDKLHHEVKNYYGVFYKDIDFWLKEKLRRIPDEFGDIESIEDENSLKITIKDWMFARDLDGWTFVDEENTIEIVRVIYSFEYVSSLEEIKK